MKTVVKGYITATKYPWDDQTMFGITSYDPSQFGDPNTVKVSEQDFLVEIPDGFDIRPAQVAALEKIKEKHMADFAKKVKEIDDQINSLLAISNGGSNGTTV